MTMDAMNGYLEAAGFKVERKYFAKNGKGSYRFIISKNGNYLTKEYHWPADQEAFMDRMIKEFEEEFPKRGTTPTIQTLNDLGTYLHGKGYDCNLYTREGDRYRTLTLYKQGREVQRRFPTDCPNTRIIIAALEMMDELELRFHRAEERDKVAIAEYCEHDVKNTMEVYKCMASYYARGGWQIKNVIFNPPATIIFWTDGTKTVVKAENEDFDPEKGLAMAISKKALGNKGNYFNVIKKYVTAYEQEMAAQKALMFLMLDKLDRNSKTKKKEEE